MVCRFLLRRDLAYTYLGRLLAIALSDCSISLINAHTSKTVHTFQHALKTESEICCLGWGVCFTDAAFVDKHINGTKTEVTLDDILGRGFEGLLTDLPQDLPTELANLEIESSLPKLSTLPLGSREQVTPICYKFLKTNNR